MYSKLICLGLGKIYIRHPFGSEMIVSDVVIVATRDFLLLGWNFV